MSTYWYYHQLDNNEIKRGKIVKQLNSVITSFSARKGTESAYSIIDHNIWLGNAQIAADGKILVENDIDVVINVTPQENNTRLLNTVSCIQIPIVDADACRTHIFYLMEYAADLIHNCVSSGKKVLVHCKSGHHRSASIVALYYMKYHASTISDAVYHIKCKRPTAIRRLSCMINILIDYEADLIS